VSQQAAEAPARFIQGEPVTILVSGTADDEFPTYAPGGGTYLMLATRLDDGSRVSVPCDYPGIDVIQGDIRPVLIQMAKDAITAHRPKISCRLCKPGDPCPGCVISAERRREFQDVLDALGGGE
jgi:hypothetical protein